MLFYIFREKERLSISITLRIGPQNRAHLTDIMDNTRYVNELESLAKEFSLLDLRCPITYGVEDVEIILEWVYGTMQKRKKLVTTTPHPFTDSG